MKNKMRLIYLKLFSSFCIIIIASQCFAQSPSVSANEAANSSNRYLRIIDSVFNYAQQRYVDEIDAKILYEGAMKGMMEAMGDPYTLYLNKDAMREMKDTTSGSFGGIGLTVSKVVPKNGDRPAYVEVVSPVKDTPGEKAGIAAGDLITAIDGIATVDLTLNEAVNKLRGQIGTSVNVSILRGSNIQFDRTLVRALIEVPTVQYEMIGKLGYIQIFQFTPDTAKHVQEGIEEFKQNDFTGLIIDVRNNPGGLITSAIAVVDEFVDSGTIVSTKGRFDFENFSSTANPDNTVMPRNLPIVVLINKGSASASEILSGALKDDKRAYLVGENTYGKGSVQQLVPLGENDGVKMTTARYYTPTGMNIDKIGIPPDREVLFPVLSKEESETFAELMKADDISSYVKKHPDMTEQEIASYAVVLNNTYKLDLRTLRRIVRLEVMRFKGGIKYDLDYDVQLNTAIEILQKEDFFALMQNTKTLKELQEERQKESATEKT